MVVHPLATAVVQAVQVPFITSAHPVSHPSAALLLVSNLLVAQVTAVQSLASAVEQAVQIPFVTAAHETSQPLVASLSTLSLPAMQATAVHPPATAELHAVQIPPATAAQQLKSSLFEVVAYWFEGQVEHASASTNGFNSGFAM